VQEIDIRVESSAPTSRVYDLIADVSTWPQWAGFDGAVADGDLRRFCMDGRRSVERVTALERNRYAYELVSGLPLRNYRAEVTFTPNRDGGTDIRWHSTFNAKLPGTGSAIRRRLEPFIRNAAGNQSSPRTWCNSSA